MPLSNIYGVDLGSDSAKIYSLRKMRTMTEKNMIAVKDGDQVIAVGNVAYEMLEKNPPDIDVRCPVAGGMIADTDRAGFILRKLIRRADASMGAAPSVYFAAPLEMSRMQQRAFIDVGLMAGIRSSRIFLVDRPICDAVAVGLGAARSKGTMIVNIGKSSTVFSVFSGGQVIMSRYLPAGAGAIDEAVADLIRQRYNVMVGLRTGSRLKMALADLTEGGDARRTVGMDVLSGVPKEIVISAETVRDAVRQVLDGIGTELSAFLARIPPQIAGPVRESGIRLTGGGAKIRGIGPFLTEAAGVPVTAEPLGELSVITGLAEIIAHKQLRSVAYSVKERDMKTV